MLLFSFKGCQSYYEVHFLIKGLLMLLWCPFSHSKVFNITIKSIFSFKGRSIYLWSPVSHSREVNITMKSCQSYYEVHFLIQGRLILLWCPVSHSKGVQYYYEVHYLITGRSMLLWTRRRLWWMKRCRKASRPFTLQPPMIMWRLLVR